MDAEIDDGESEPNMITVYTDNFGNLNFNVFSIDQWNMIDDIAELTEQNKFDIIQGLSNDESVRTWTIDPSEFPNEYPNQEQEF